VPLTAGGVAGLSKAGYQPVWEDGREHGVGWRAANGRYEATKRYLVTRMARE